MRRPSSADFLRALRREMLAAVEKIREDSIGRAEVPQSVIDAARGPLPAIPNTTARR